MQADEVAANEGGQPTSGAPSQLDNREGGEVSALKNEEDKQLIDEIEEAPIDDATLPQKDGPPEAEKTDKAEPIAAEETIQEAIE